MMKHRFTKIVCTLLLCLIPLSALTGCARLTGETVAIYPCYFNRDAENANYTANTPYNQKKGAYHGKQIFYHRDRCKIC